MTGEEGLGGLPALATCPVCETPSTMVIGPTQALCTNDIGCAVLIFNPSLPDGGLSDPQFINLEEY